MSDSASSSKPAPGIVYLVGAGPGDPDLITVKALRLIERADCIVFDALANPALLNSARPDAELIDVGKRAKAHKLSQDQTNSLLAERALAGKTVVRLKGGDPYVFGRGSEEAMYLHERGVRSIVVPGITAAMAGPAYAGIPVTHRNVATTVTFITGHEDPTKGESQIDYQGLARLAIKGGTLCFYMGMGRLQVIVDELCKHGVSADMPAAIVQWGTLPEQRSLRASLHDLPAAAQKAGLGAPAIIVIGPVVDVDTDGALQWFEKRPLFGQTIVITRTRHQASDLRIRLEELGACVLEAPTIEIEPPPSWDEVDLAITGIGKYDWLILTSVNGVAGLRQRLGALNLDARHLAGVKIAAIGDATARALTEIGLRPDVVPTRFVAESLSVELLSQHEMSGARVLMLRADIARPLLREKLTEAGAAVDDVCVYRTKTVESLADGVLNALRGGRVNWVTFTSSSTVRNFVTLLGDERDLLQSTPIASIGPITSKTVLDSDLQVSIEADEHNIDGLVAALCGAAQRAASPQR